MNDHVGFHAIAPARLVLRSPPLDRESPRGWYLRLSEMNGYDNPSWMVGRASAHEMARRAAALSGYPMDLYSGRNSDVGTERAARRHGVNVSRRYMRAPCSALCPLCVTEDGLLLAEWDLAFWSVCPRHGCGMVLSCTCGRKLAWDRPGVAVCANRRCGRDLGTIPTVQANPDAADLVACIGRAIGIEHVCRDPRMQAVLQASTVGQLTATIRLLCKPWLWLSSVHGVDPVFTRTAAAVSIAASLLSGWPDGLRARLDPTSSSGSQYGTGAIRLLLNRTATAPIEEGFRSTLSGTLQDLLYVSPSRP